MEEPKAVILESRGVLLIEGEDRVSFLQGLVSNDVTKVTQSASVWSAVLTPQGKFLHDFFLSDLNGEFLLDTEAERIDDLRRHLARYKLRANVSLREAGSEWRVAVAWGGSTLEALGLSKTPGSTRAFEGGLAYTDPRLNALGARLLLPHGRAAETLRQHFAVGDLYEYDELRISLGVPDGSRDMEVSRSILLENGFDELGGVDWNKGCFIGQELTARTKYRALIKKRLLPVVFDGTAPEPGAPVYGDGREVGILRSTASNRGLALLRLEAVKGPANLEAGGKPLRVELPPWAQF